MSATYRIAAVNILLTNISFVGHRENPSPLHNHLNIDLEADLPNALPFARENGLPNGLPCPLPMKMVRHMPCPLRMKMVYHFLQLLWSRMLCYHLRDGRNCPAG
jgi:hypothetical protein